MLACAMVVVQLRVQEESKVPPPPPPVQAGKMCTAQACQREAFHK